MRALHWFVLSFLFLQQHGHEKLCFKWDIRLSTVTPCEQCVWGCKTSEQREDGGGRSGEEGGGERLWCFSQVESERHSDPQANEFPERERERRAHHRGTFTITKSGAEGSSREDTHCSTKGPHTHTLTVSSVYTCTRLKNAWRLCTGAFSSLSSQVKLCS